MKIKILIFGIVLLFVFGCAKYSLDYDISLFEVERPR